MQNLLEKLIEKGGVILQAKDCSEECVENARRQDSYYDDGNGNGCVHLTLSELTEYGGGVKNPKPN